MSGSSLNCPDELPMEVSENTSKNESDETSKEENKKEKKGPRGCPWYMRGYKRTTVRSYRNYSDRKSTTSEDQLLAPATPADDKPAASDSSTSNTVPDTPNGSDEVMVENLLRDLLQLPRRPTEPRMENSDDGPLCHSSRDASESPQTITTTQDNPPSMWGNMRTTAKSGPMHPETASTTVEDRVNSWSGGQHLASVTPVDDKPPTSDSPRSNVIRIPPSSSDEVIENLIRDVLKIPRRSQEPWQANPFGDPFFHPRDANETTTTVQEDPPSMQGYMSSTGRYFSNFPESTSSIFGPQLVAASTCVDDTPTSDHSGSSIIPNPTYMSEDTIIENFIRDALNLPRRYPESSQGRPAYGPVVLPMSNANDRTHVTTLQDLLRSRKDTKNIYFNREDLSESGGAMSEDSCGTPQFAGMPTVPRPTEASGGPVTAESSSRIIGRGKSRSVLSPINEEGIGNKFPLVNGGDMSNCQSEGNEMVGSGELAASAHEPHDDEEITQAMQRCTLHLDVCKEIDLMSYANFEGMRNSINKIVSFFSVCLPEEQRKILNETFNRSLEDQTFSAKAGAFYSVIQSMVIDKVTVKDFLFDTLKNTVFDWVTQRNIGRQKFLNAVFLLSEFYYELTHENDGSKECGETLVECLKTLITADEKDLETLTTCLVVNGTRLMQEYANSFKGLMNLVRLALRSNITSKRSRNFVLFIIDMHHEEFRYLPEDTEKLYKRLLGEDTFFGFRRMVPSLAPFLIQESSGGESVDPLLYYTSSNFPECEVAGGYPHQPDLLCIPKDSQLCYQNTFAQNPPSGIMGYSPFDYGSQACSYNTMYYSPTMERCVGNQQLPGFPATYQYSNWPGYSQQNIQQQGYPDFAYTTWPNLGHGQISLQEGNPGIGYQNTDWQRLVRPEIQQQGYPGYEYSLWPYLNHGQTSLQGYPGYEYTHWPYLNYEQTTSQQGNNYNYQF